MNAVARFLGVEEQWERPGPDRRERVRDLQLALAWFVVAALGVELIRSMGGFDDVDHGIVGQYAAIASGSALLGWRRTHPLTVAALSALHMFVVGVTIPPVMASLPMQVLYFFALYSGVAWARDRRAAAYVVLGVVTLMFAWLAWMFALGSGIAELRGAAGIIESDGSGLFPAIPAAVGYIFLSNILYFGGAVLLGQVAWRSAWRSAQVAEQAATIRAQTLRLRDQAVVAERLRIARELHDVVAHHVSVMGVQAAGARRVLDSDPAAARAALAAVEQSSRQAVGQMRELLGTLRSGEMAADAPGDAPVADLATHPASDLAVGGPERAPQPTLAGLPALVEQAQVPGCAVHYRLVEGFPGAAGRVPPPVQLSAYRVVQEALANVRKHSTASQVRVVVRVDDHVEVDVVDNGSPRPNTSGTGLGQLGIRERAQHLGGTAELGRRHGGGYRVWVRFPVGVTEAVR